MSDETKDAERLGEFFSNISNEYFEDQFKPSHSVYIDLEMFQDFRLGALLCLAKTEIEFKYIQHRMPLYMARFDNNTMSYFPAIKQITEEEIDAYIANPDNHRILAKLSPFNDLYRYFPTILSAIKQTNLQCGSSNRRLELAIGTNSVIYDQHEKQALKDQFATLGDLGLELTIYNRPVWEMEPTTATSFDAYFIYWTGEYFRHELFYKAIFENYDFSAKRVFCHPTIEEEPTEESPLAAMLELTHGTFSIYCNFEYIQRDILAEPDEEAEEQSDKPQE